MIDDENKRIFVETQGYDSESCYILISQITKIHLMLDEHIHGLIIPCLGITFKGNKHIMYLTQEYSVKINEKFNLNFKEIKTLILK